MTATRLAALDCSAADTSPTHANLLLNPRFAFHAFRNHREGRSDSFQSHNVAFWNCSAWGDITVVREAHVSADIRPQYSVRNLISIAPGKSCWQFLPLPDACLSHGDRLSLIAYGYQPQPNALRARVQFLKLDSEDGTWSPAEFGMSDQRTFPRHARGELVPAGVREAQTESTGRVVLRIEDAEIPGRYHDDQESHSEDINTIALRVEFENASADEDVWVWWPCLCSGPKALPRLPDGRAMEPVYRHIPRTIQKLWKAEPLHIILMGSSIDRGSANPPMYLYDEDPASGTFKHPLSGRVFEPDRVNRPDLDGYIGWWQHYWSYAGRLRLELMRKYNLPVNRLLLNFMACDGSCVGEAHSGLEAYCSLSLPPSEHVNGHKAGADWQGLYPGLFSRPGGTGPDLVIFGSGANEKTDTPDEVAVFEGMIRWIQRRYPQTEFIFCQFQNRGGYTPNPGDLQALALRYQVPFMDYGKLGDDVTRWCNPYALVPRDGHPQAASHFLWFKSLEKAFECWDPTVAGQTQLHLPERVHPNSYGWEGEIVTYGPDSQRLQNARFVFDDTTLNCWGDVSEGKPVPYVDGMKQSARRKSPARDLRNSMFRFGRCRLGDRHILEIEGQDARLTYVDAKICPNRRFFGVENASWQLRGAPLTEFPSDWGAPYGSTQALLQPGTSAEIQVLATDVSVAYVDAAQGGPLRVLVDGVEKLVVATDQPFTDRQGGRHFMENRRGIHDLHYGLHTVQTEAGDRPVAILGLFIYDRRPNRQAERRLIGRAHAGEAVTFSPPFKARPFVICHGELHVDSDSISPRQVTFGGTGPGTYEVVGE